MFGKNLARRNYTKQMYLEDAYRRCAKNRYQEPMAPVQSVMDGAVVLVKEAKRITPCVDVGGRVTYHFCQMKHCIRV